MINKYVMIQVPSVSCIDTESKSIDSDSASKASKQQQQHLNDN